MANNTSILKKYTSHVYIRLILYISFAVSYKCNKSVEVYYSNNSPKNHELNEDAKEMFNILEDIIHLCELYY